MKWLTRVTEAKRVLQYAGPLEDLEIGYQGKEFLNEYGEVKQRWLLVFSEQAYLREEKTLKKQIQREKEQKTVELNRWARTDFDCENDAKEALLRCGKKLNNASFASLDRKSTRLHAGKGRPKAGASV